MDFSIIQAPSGEEILEVLKKASRNIDDLTDRELWILEECGAGFE